MDFHIRSAIEYIPYYHSVVSIEVSSHDVLVHVIRYNERMKAHLMCFIDINWW